MKKPYTPSSGFMASLALIVFVFGVAAVSLSDAVEREVYWGELRLDSAKNGRDLIVGSVENLNLARQINAEVKKLACRR